MPLYKRDVQRSIRDILKHQKSFDELSWSMENELINAMRRAETKIMERMGQLVADMPSIKTASRSKLLAWYAEQRRELHGAFVDSGYYSGIADYIKQYDALTALNAQLIHAGGIDPAFAKFPNKLINELTFRDRLFFKELNTSAYRYFDTVFLNSVIGSRSKYGMLSTLRGALTGDYKWGSRRGLYEWHAGTYARTFHQRFSRTLIANQTNEHGFREFLYVGAVDGKVRPFCRELLGNVFTLDDISQMDNGQTGDVFIDGGGYNCRHKWNPISDELAKSIRTESTWTTKDPPAGVPDMQPPAKPKYPEKPPRFESRADAERFIKDYMHNNIIPGGRVDLDECPLNIAQSFIDEFYAFQRANPNVAKLYEFIVEYADNPNAVASFLANTSHGIGSIRINREFLDNLIASGTSFDDYALSGYEAGWWAAKKGSDLAYHETMHYYHRLAMTNEMRNKLPSIYEQVKKLQNGFRIAKSVSEYADFENLPYDKRMAEWFAETMTRIRVSGTAGLPTELIEIFTEAGIL